MKKLIHIAFGLALVFGMSSCEDYLDVNTDPDNPVSETVSPQLRLPWIQNYYAYAWGTASMRTNTIAGIMTQTGGTAANSLLSSWNPAQSSCTTIYQNFYLGAGVNIDPLIEKAETEGAYHYEGAAYCIKAMGFMMMLDLHGELPVQEAFTGKTNPAYDDGKTMYELCMGYLDKAIENFGKQQNTTAPALSAGDLWNGGEVSKWLKLCYGLKARYLLKLSKKADLYDPEAILTALNSAPQSNDDNTIMKHYNVEGDEVNFTVSDPYQASVIWDCTGYGSTQRLTRWYVNLLTNEFTGGSGVKDPRLSKLVPAMMTNVKLNADGKITANEWIRDAGVDVIHSTTRAEGGPVAALFVTGGETGYNKEKGGFMITYDLSKADNETKTKFIADAQAIHQTTVDGNNVTVLYQKGSAYCNNKDYKRAGDTIYVNLRSNGMANSGRNTTDMYYYTDAKSDYVGGTGTFYARPNSDSDILTYSEMCFIKAEVLFRKGDTDGALDAYQKGIKANFDRMQAKLKSWEAEGTKNPDQKPMDESEISTYMASSSVCQNAASLTLFEVMRQKIIALGINTENWNDMRRLDYDYVDYDRPQDFTAVSKIVGTSKNEPTYWFRRFSQSTHESNYNLTQLKASNKQAMTDPIWSCPVWWDCATDNEYYGYIK